MNVDAVSGVSVALCLLRNDESLYITILVSPKTKTDFKSQEKPGSS